MPAQDVRGRRRTASSATNGVQDQFDMNEYNEQFVAQAMPAYTEMTRLGQGWSTMSVTAYAALVTRPTTTAAVQIYNGYPSGSNICLIIDRIFCEWRIATAVASSAIMYASVGPQTAIVNALTTRGNSGSAYGGSVAATVDDTVTDNGWFPWGNSITGALAAATPNGGHDSRVEGRIIVRPGHALCLHVVASVTGDTFVQGASWYERALTLVG